MTDWPAGIGLTVHQSIDSTNEEARRLAAAGQTGPLWIAAHRQTVGRGRQGRNWQSEPGNLAATLLMPFAGGPADAALLSFTASLAVADTFAALAPGVDVALKWPNDVLLNRRKASGILLESVGRTQDGQTLLAIGIGLNLAHHPDVADLRWPPTSVAAETGRTPDFDEALSLLATSLDRRLAQHRDQGFARIRADWLARAVNIGQQIEVRLPNETLTGRFDGLDMTGALVLEGASGRRLIAAGDVFFPEAA